MGLVWDWLIAKVRLFVRVTDTAITYAYRWFARLTADWLEPYIRVAVLTLVVGLVAWALYTVNRKPHTTIPAMDHFIAIPRAPSVVTTTLPPPSASPKDLGPLDLYKAKDLAAKKDVRKRKPKPKCNAVFC